jgi:chaperonin GroEL
MERSYMKNQVKAITGEECRKNLLEGVNIMGDTVGSTLGARGTNVGYVKLTPQGEVYARSINHDGVSVAESINLKDEAINFSAQILKEAAQKQRDAVGDGTTAVIVLAQAIINECFKIIGSGTNPMSLINGLNKGKDLIVSELKKQAIPVSGIKDLIRVASISARDEELGKIIAETLQKVGKDGVVTAEESKSEETTAEIQKGMQLDRGWLHPFFITNPQRMEALLENAYFLITDQPITSFIKIQNLLGEFVKQSKIIVIISPEIGGDVTPLLLKNKYENNSILPLCIQAPSMGEDQKNILQDLAILTDAKFISEEKGDKLEDIKVDDLGFAEYICSTKEDTIITGGRGTKEDIKKRAQAIKKQMDELDEGFDKERMKARYGKLTDGVAVIRVGGNTEIEMKGRRERVIDSIAATRAAMRTGIVPGGEVVYLEARKALQAFISPIDLPGKSDFNPLTNKILYQALYIPFQKLITNAGFDEVEIALAMNNKSKEVGIDVTDGQVKNLIKAGIIDPVEVSVEAIKNAISVAIEIVTTRNIIVPDLQEK